MLKVSCCRRHGTYLVREPAFSASHRRGVPSKQTVLRAQEAVSVADTRNRLGPGCACQKDLVLKQHGLCDLSLRRGSERQPSDQCGLLLVLSPRWANGSAHFGHAESQLVDGDAELGCAALI